VARTGTGKRLGRTARGKAMRWLSTHRGCKEQPPGSNRDQRVDGITAAQRRLGAWLVGLAWCGTWAANALLAAGVVGVSFRQASVSLIEDDARAGKAPFRDWLSPTLGNLLRCLRGDLVVLFGRGVHVATLRAIKFVRGVGWVLITEEGNTSLPGVAASQSDGGVSCRRERPLAQVHGLARVDFPGGRARRAAGAVGLIARSVAAQVAGLAVGHDVHHGPVGAQPSESSDRKLLMQVARNRGRRSPHDVPLEAFELELVRSGVRS
jgi:hypothetical protein